MRGRGGTTEAPELAPWRKTMGFGFPAPWNQGTLILLQSSSKLEKTCVFALGFSPVFKDDSLSPAVSPVAPQPLKVLQQRSQVPSCLARTRGEAALPAPHLGLGRCSAAASGLPMVGRGL